MMDGKALGEELAEMVRHAMDRKMAPLLKRLETAEAEIKAGHARIKALEGRGHD